MSPREDDRAGRGPGRGRTQHYYSSSPRRSDKSYVIKFTLKGRIIELASSGGVFSKDKVDLGTQVLLSSLDLPERGDVLDLGCGYGVIGITIAKLRPGIKVTMADVNPVAIKLACQNIERNGVGNASALVSDLYSALGGATFDMIVSNPPLAAGYAVIFPLIEGALPSLKPGGRLVLVLRKGVNAIPRKMEAVFGNVTLASRKSGYRVFISKSAPSGLGGSPAERKEKAKEEVPPDS